MWAAAPSTASWPPCGDHINRVATALLLQAYEWKVALGIEVEDRPFAKSTLQLFRAQLILHDRVDTFARQTGCLKGRRMKVAVDTTYILQGHLQPAADGIVQVVRALAQLGPGPRSGP